MEFPLSKGEEMIFREIRALSGDMEQIAVNMVRNYEERLKVAEAQRERSKKEADSKGGRVVVGMPMMALNRPSLLGDLRFIQDRLSTVIKYAEGGYVPPYDQGEAKSIR